MIETIPESEKAHVVGRLTWQINADNQLFAEGSYYWAKFTQRGSPTPVASYETIPYVPLSMALPPTSPYYPTAFVAGLPGGDPTLPLELIYRTVELGPRTDQAKVDQWNAVVGLQGTVKGWDYQLAANYTTNQQIDSYVSGWVYASKFGELLRSGVVNPFAANTPAVLDLMRATQITGQANDNRATNYGADFKLANTVYDLPSGPIAVALGVEGRREGLEQSNSDFIISGDALSTGGAVATLPAAHRTVWSLFGEVNVPIVMTVEINVAVRYDHYSDFGGTTNPKVTLRWQPARTLMLRGAYGTGFRAPTLSDMFQPPSLNLRPVLARPRSLSGHRGGFARMQWVLPDKRGGESCAPAGEVAAGQRRHRSRADGAVVSKPRLLLGQGQERGPSRAGRHDSRTRLHAVVGLRRSLPARSSTPKPPGQDRVHRPVPDEPRHDHHVGHRYQCAMAQPLDAHRPVCRGTQRHVRVRLHAHGARVVARPSLRRHARPGRRHRALPAIRAARTGRYGSWGATLANNVPVRVRPSLAGTAILPAARCGMSAPTRSGISRAAIPASGT